VVNRTSEGKRFGFICARSASRGRADERLVANRFQCRIIDARIGHPGH